MDGVRFRPFHPTSTWCQIRDLNLGHLQANVSPGDRRLSGSEAELGVESMLDLSMDYYTSWTQHLGRLDFTHTWCCRWTALGQEITQDQRVSERLPVHMLPISFYTNVGFDPLGKLG